MLPGMDLSSKMTTADVKVQLPLLAYRKWEKLALLYGRDGAERDGRLH